MLTALDPLRQLDLASLLFRLALAMFFGGMIGMERERKRRPAGFRTYMLVCLGATLAAIVSQYNFIMLNTTFYETMKEVGRTTDVSRIGAKVIGGIGFLGAGTVIVTGRQEVKGLTTAAGLWASAIIGLTIGGGFYEGALLATGLVFFAESVLSRLEYRMLDHVPEINLYMEYADKSSLEEVLRLFRENRVSLQDMEITRASGSESHNACAIFSLRFSKGVSVDELLTKVTRIDGVVSVQEL